jgi:hypothetical protein
MSGKGMKSEELFSLPFIPLSLPGKPARQQFEFGYERNGGHATDYQADDEKPRPPRDAAAEGLFPIHTRAEGVALDAGAWANCIPAGRWVRA